MSTYVDPRELVASFLGRPLTRTEGQCVFFGQSLEAQRQQLGAADHHDMAREAFLLSGAAQEAEAEPA